MVVLIDVSESSVFPEARDSGVPAEAGVPAEDREPRSLWLSGFSGGLFHTLDCHFDGGDECF